MAPEGQRCVRPSRTEVLLRHRSRALGFRGSSRWALALLCVLVPRAAGAHTCGGTTACACGDTVARNYTLPSDIGCPQRATGLTVTSGVTVDGAGHKLTGAGDLPHGNDNITIGSSVYGVYLRAVTGATVKNLDVSRFRQGIRVYRGGGNTIADVQIHDNGNFVALTPGGNHDGYGVAFVKSKGNTVTSPGGQTVIAANADEGIHFGTGSSGNAVVDSVIQFNEEEQLYLVNTQRNLFLNNTVWAGAPGYCRGNQVPTYCCTGVDAGTCGTVGAYVKNSDQNVFIGNGFYTAAVIFIGDSDHNDFGRDGRGNTIDGGRLEFQQLEQSPFSPPHDNRVYRASITNTAAGHRYCVHFKMESLSAPLPYGNAISEAALQCNRGQVAVDGPGVTSGGPNALCAATCRDASGDTTVCAISDPNRPSLVTQQSAPCLP